MCTYKLRGVTYVTEATELNWRWRECDRGKIFLIGSYVMNDVESRTIRRIYSSSMGRDFLRIFSVEVLRGNTM
jgi:hypothetical protein